jgi:hypothetical protein
MVTLKNVSDEGPKYLSLKFELLFGRKQEKWDIDDWIPKTENSIHVSHIK